MTQIKLRRDTAANFASVNPILGNGEPAYETDTKKLKIGDGTTAYTQLEYFSTGGGDVTAAGDNTFTGTNTFDKMVLPSDFDGVKGICIDGKLTASIYAGGDYLNLRNVGQISGGSGSDLVIGTEVQKTRIRGSSVVDKRSKIFLTQGNVTAGDNVTITDTTDGIQISATGGGSNLRYPVEVSDKSLMPSWYVVYNDGWCEQGGRTGAVGNDVHVNFLKTYSNVPVVVGLGTVIGGVIDGALNIYNLSTTGFNTHWIYDAKPKPISWQASGYIN